MKIPTQYRSLLFLSTLMYILNAAIEILSDLLLGALIDHASMGNSTAILYDVIIMIVSEALFLLTAKTAVYFRTMYVKRQMIELKRSVVKGILSMRLKDFLRNDQAYYLNLLSNDADKMDEDYYRILPLFLYYMFKVVLCVALLLTIHWILFIAYAFFLTLPLIVSQIMSKSLYKKQNESSKANQSFLFSIRDIIAGFETIKLGTARDDVEQRFEAVNEEAQEKKRLLTDKQLMIVQVNIICSSTAQLSCIALGGILIIMGLITTGSLINSIQLANGCFSAINMFSERRASVRSVGALSEKLKLMQQVKEESLDPKPLSLTVSAEAGAEVTYRNVSFSFGEKKILSGFSQTFAPGKVYGLIGPSGSGKSTAIKLLMRYYDDYDGFIALNGRDIHDIPEPSLYRAVKYVEQTPHIFNATLRENITLFRSFTRETVDSVIERVNLTELAASCGDNLIGDEGGRISGGERQRIALARALLENPSVLIFDEPTSALDPVNAERIMELIFSMKDYTRIVITHSREEKFMSAFDGIVSFEKHNE